MLFQIDEDKTQSIRQKKKLYKDQKTTGEIKVTREKNYKEAKIQANVQ